MTERRRQARWQVALVVALATCLLAVALGLPSLFFLAIVALGFVLAGELSGSPAIGSDDPGAEASDTDRNRTAAIDGTANGDADADRPVDADGDRTLRLERTLSETRVRPGESVTVTIAATNESSRVFPDLRVVDEPPAGAPVTAGSPAFATAVRPGETVGHEYELTPPRGEFTFGSPTVRARSLAATAVATAERDPAGDAAFTCETLLDAFPFQDRTIQFVGQAPTDDGGSGIEFFSTRSYRRGDPINRIDWHRFARTRELTTIEYREERAVTIVFVLDDRLDAHRERPGGGPDSFDLTLYAASQGVVASLEDGNRTGLATLSGGDWVDPGAGSGVRRRVEDALEGATADAGRVERAGSPVADGGEPNESNRSSPTDRSEDRSERSVTSDANRTSSAEAANGDRGNELAIDLERRFPNRAQVAFCTPLLDGDAVELVETLRTRGRAVTVVTPDVTVATGATDPAPGARIAGLERTNRIDALQGLGAAVVDWDLAEPISVALARTFRARTAGGGRR